MGASGDISARGNEWLRYALLWNWFCSMIEPIDIAPPGWGSEEGVELGACLM